ncbi:DUF6708 domain-containing protein [Lysobacter sp. F60174L2]|uniref:DUF6708 domain-containing protein n=1 Tax=Lysobacter sp. F60174L2 TaxID=3459295 RepID=UPI00403DCA2B
MDYEGLDYRNIRYPVDRPLTDEERTTRYDPDRVVSAPPMDFLSVIKLNSTYMDLVDRWYPIKGFNAWLGSAVAFGGVFLAGISGTAFLWAPESSDRSALWFLLLVLAPLSLGLVWAGWWLIRTESWRWTHYPMRLNRKTRQVHVFRQNGTVLTVPWDDLYIVRGEAKSPLAGTTYDLRAHVLDADAETVRESFSLGYTWPCTKESMNKFWAFLQPYMEAPDGMERTYRHLKGKDGNNVQLLPIDGRKEGWRWSIARTFAPGGHWPWAQILMCIPFGLNAIGRMFAMWTSKQPVWPPEVEEANPVDPDDPYILSWRDNGPLGWWELYWPLVCTILGIGIFFGAIGSILIKFLD